MTEHDHGGAGRGSADPVGHYELSPLPWLAGCSDVGRRHEINQDALSLAGRDTDTGQVAVVVISDGVSTSVGSEQSAAIAAKVTTSTLVDTLRRHDVLDAELVSTALADAVAAAHDSVVTSRPVPGASDPGSCTLIAGVLWQGTVLVGNVGDCRAYWVSEDGSGQVLSVDDSVAQARIDMGMTREEAESGYQAHAITRWLGPDSRDATPRQVQMELTTPGWLLLCSDGLWNYCSPAEQMSALVLEAAARCGEDVAATAQMLVDWANAQGGRDNITVALARVEPGPAA